METRIGCDVLACERMRNALELPADDPFLRATFSPAERGYIRALDSEGEQLRALTEAFALKEAAFKCLHLDDRGTAALEAATGRRCTLADIEVDLAARPWPQVALAADVAAALGVESNLESSLSWDAGLVFAVCLARLV